ncbi:TPA: indolepyruvate oxidoreductase subunit beta [Candidatus Poribacteria bacterium]|nr:indolepyruvate oxidoreductase subunit beta [Candidatus Poribacteria bacterium]
MTRNLILCGVGGQGILLASTVISNAALRSGYDVKTNEVHGMAQRGGSVVAQIRFGERVHSPLIKRGTADYMLALEKIEALRYANYVKPDGVVIVAQTEIIPTTVSTGMARYPENVEELLRRRFKNLYMVDGLSIARESGEPRAANVALIGALSNFLPFEERVWEEVVSETVPSRVLQANLKAFRSGKKAIQTSILT